MSNLWLEIQFALQDNSVRWILIAATLLSVIALVSGHLVIEQQRDQLTQLQTSIAEEKAYVLPQQQDAGGAAYYLFHLTYDPPSPLAFAALGVRNELTWKHRIRMLALEGQIHEADPGNPEVSVLGKLDFAYLVSILLPLFIIGLLFDLEAGEKRNGRYELLCASCYSGSSILAHRALARVLLLLVATVSPFMVLAGIYSVPVSSIIGVVLVVALHGAVWYSICRGLTRRLVESSTTLIALVAIWLVMVLVIPVFGKALAEHQVSLPQGGEILLTQRETVNGAWDLPKEKTMEPFFATHPQWENTAPVTRPFEWKWYYAFQQVGDQTVEPLTKALTEGVSKRDQLIAWIAWLSPPLLSERWLSSMAKTDTKQNQRYLKCVRDFHGSLRDFHYPMLFGDESYSQEKAMDVPQYKPCD